MNAGELPLEEVLQFIVRQVFDLNVLCGPCRASLIGPDSIIGRAGRDARPERELKARGRRRAASLRPSAGAATGGSRAREVPEVTDRSGVS